MRQYLLFASLIILALSLSPSTSATTGQNWTVSGDTVYWNSSWGRITVWPHTDIDISHHSQRANITWYLAANTLDFAFVFDYPVNGSVLYLNQTTQVWGDITSHVVHSTLNGQDYYSIPNVNFAQNETKQIWFSYNTPPGKNGKWTLLAKLSSDSIATAYSTGRYLQLDPWYNTSLVARYEFNDGSGTTLGDAGPFALNGNIVGSPTWGTGAGCLENGCLNFTGSSQYVNISDNVNLRGWLNFTIFGWYKLDKLGIVQNILAKDNTTTGPGRAYSIYLDASNNVNFNYWNDSGSIGDIAANPPGGANANTSFGVCFALERDTSLATNNMQVYFNSIGSPATMTQTNVASKPNGIIQNAPGVPLRIGQREDGTQQFNGSIDRVWIFNRTLTGSELNTLCSSALFDTTPPVVNLTSPTNTSYSTSSVAVNVSLDENTGNVTFQLNSTTNYTLTQAPGGNWSVLLTGLTNGAYNGTVFANDSNGNMNASQTIYFSVSSDNAPPNITLLAPANLTKFENRNFSIQVNASDNVGLDTLVVDFGGVNVTKNTGLVNGSNNITLTGLNDGNVTYYVVANDSAGNKNATDKRIVTIDTKNATLTNILVSKITDKAATVTFTSNRQVNVTVTTGGVSNTYDTNTSNSTFGTSQTVDLINLNASTTYFFKVFAWNLASNLTDSGQYNFTTTAINSVGSGSFVGGGSYYTITPVAKVVELANKTLEAVLNIAAPKVSLLYITQDTTACWIHKISEVLPPDNPTAIDPCFPTTLYAGEAVQVAALAYFTNGSVISYTWWVSNPTLRIQPPASSLDVVLAMGAYPLGVDIAMTTGQIFSFNRSVNVVAGAVPRLPRSAMVLNLIRDVMGGVLEVVTTPLHWGRQIVAPSLSMVGGGTPTTSGDANKWWNTLLWSNGKADVTNGKALILVAGLIGYVYLGQGKKPKIMRRRR